MLLEVSEPSHVAFVRRQAALFSERCGLDEAAAGRLALITTEIGTNLIKHGSGGRIALNTYDDGSGRGVEVVALDAGEGIADIPRAFGDGYSTAGSSGHGLSIIQRQSDQMTLFSRPGKGTVLVARIGDNSKPDAAKAVVGAMVDPYPGETVCGDAWVHLDSPMPTLVVADGSGHGIPAETAAKIAVKIVKDNPAESCLRLMELIHRALFATRGAAVAIARVDAEAGVVRYVGIGNIVGVMFSGREIKRMVSHNGTAGSLSPRVQEFHYPFTAPPTVVMHSDGLSAKWNPEDYPGFMTAHPSVVAGLLFRDFRRGRDDATVVALRSPAP